MPGKKTIPTYPPNPGKDGRARVSWTTEGRKKDYFFGNHGTDDSFVLFTRWSDHIVQHGEPVPVAEVQHMLNLERAERLERARAERAADRPEPIKLQLSEPLTVDIPEPPAPQVMVETLEPQVVQIAQKTEVRPDMRFTVLVCLTCCLATAGLSSVLTYSIVRNSVIPISSGADVSDGRSGNPEASRRPSFADDLKHQIATRMKRTANQSEEERQRRIKALKDGMEAIRSGGPGT